jgi:hypothetical protein
MIGFVLCSLNLKDRNKIANNLSKYYIYLYLSEKEVHLNCKKVNSLAYLLFNVYISLLYLMCTILIGIRIVHINNLMVHVQIRCVPECSPYQKVISR